MGAGCKLRTGVGDGVVFEILPDVGFDIGALFTPDGDLFLTLCIFADGEGVLVDRVDVGRDVDVIGGGSVGNEFAVGGQLDAGIVINDTDHITVAEHNIGDDLVIGSGVIEAVGGIYGDPFAVNQCHRPGVVIAGESGIGDFQNAQHKIGKLGKHHTVAIAAGSFPDGIHIFQGKTAAVSTVGIVDVLIQPGHNCLGLFFVGFAVLGDIDVLISRMGGVCYNGDVGLVAGSGAVHREGGSLCVDRVRRCNIRGQQVHKTVFFVIIRGFSGVDILEFSTEFLGILVDRGALFASQNGLCREQIISRPVLVYTF